MKPQSGIRPVWKWGGVVVTAALIAAWIASGWWRLEWVLPAHYGFALDRGFIGVAGGLHTVGLTFDGPSRWAMVWSPHWVLGSSIWEIVIPLWIPTLGAAFATWLVWRRDARHRREAAANRCPGCGYDRTGLEPGSVCPECGAAAD